MKKLKPCRCGNEKVSLEKFNDDPQYIIRCYHCYSSSGIRNTREEMIAEWNTRPIEDRQSVIIAAQARLIDTLDDWLFTIGIPEYSLPDDVIQARADLEALMGGEK